MTTLSPRATSFLGSFAMGAYTTILAVILTSVDFALWGAILLTLAVLLFPARWRILPVAYATLAWNLAWDALDAWSIGVSVSSWREGRIQASISASQLDRVPDEAHCGAVYVRSPKAGAFSPAHPADR